MIRKFSFFTLLLSSHLLIAQTTDTLSKWSFGFGIMPGISSLYIRPTDIQVDINTKSIFTTSAGFALTYKASKKLILATQLLLDQKGVKIITDPNSNSPFNTGVNSSYSINRIYYLSIPITANFIFYDKNKTTLSAGLGIMASAPIYYYSKTVFYTFNNDVITSKNFSSNSNFPKYMSYLPTVNLNYNYLINDKLSISIYPQANITYTPNFVFDNFHYWTAGVYFSVLKRI
jgi:hypothetical protein